jgi:F1F0 ATPase subunit 2
MSRIDALIAGAGLGIVFYGGLWLTVRHLLRRPRGPVWLWLSNGIRLAVVGLSFYGIGREGPDKLVLGLGGLWLARWGLVHHLGGQRHGR